MDNDAMNAVYEMARDVYFGKADVKVCKSKLFELYRVKERSFEGWFVPLFRHMIDGALFKGAVPQPLLDLYLKRIYQEYGKKGLRNALESHKSTIQYYDQRGTNMPGYKKIYEKYHKILNEG